MRDSGVKGKLPNLFSRLLEAKVPLCVRNRQDLCAQRFEFVLLW